jgi:hypothetical protein
MPVIDASEIVTAAPIKRAYQGGGRVIDLSEIVDSPDSGTKIFNQTPSINQPA